MAGEDTGVSEDNGIVIDEGVVKAFLSAPPEQAKEFESRLTEKQVSEIRDIMVNMPPELYEEVISGNTVVDVADREAPVQGVPALQAEQSLNAAVSSLEAATEAGGESKQFLTEEQRSEYIKSLAAGGIEATAEGLGAMAGASGGTFVGGPGVGAVSAPTMATMFGTGARKLITEPLGLRKPEPVFGTRTATDAAINFAIPAAGKLLGVGKKTGRYATESAQRSGRLSESTFLKPSTGMRRKADLAILKKQEKALVRTRAMESTGEYNPVTGIFEGRKPGKFIKETLSTKPQDVANDQIAKLDRGVTAAREWRDKGVIKLDSAAASLRTESGADVGLLYAEQLEAKLNKAKMGEKINRMLSSVISDEQGNALKTEFYKILQDFFEPDELRAVSGGVLTKGAPKPKNVSEVVDLIRNVDDTISQLKGYDSQFMGRLTAGDESIMIATLEAAQALRQPLVESLKDMVHGIKTHAKVHGGDIAESISEITAENFSRNTHNMSVLINKRDALSDSLGQPPMINTAAAPRISFDIPSVLNLRASEPVKASSTFVSGVEAGVIKDRDVLRMIQDQEFISKSVRGRNVSSVRAAAARALNTPGTGIALVRGVEVGTDIALMISDIASSDDSELTQLLAGKIATDMKKNMEKEASEGPISQDSLDKIPELAEKQANQFITQLMETLETDPDEAAFIFSQMDSMFNLVEGKPIPGMVNMRGKKTVPNPQDRIKLTDRAKRAVRSDDITSEEYEAFVSGLTRGLKNIPSFLRTPVSEVIEPAISGFGKELMKKKSPLIQ